MKPMSTALLAGTALAACLSILGGCAKAPDPALSSVPVAAANVADSDVTSHVQTALLQDETLKGLSIGVETIKGDVRLSGMLDSQAQVDSALRIARAAEGVHSIHDELTVKK